MLLEAPQVWRMKWYNILETELVYKMNMKQTFLSYLSGLQNIK